eukprot:PhF_6_TR31844/c0_g1_i2/m.47163
MRASYRSIALTQRFVRPAQNKSKNFSFLSARRNYCTTSGSSSSFPSRTAYSLEFEGSDVVQSLDVLAHARLMNYLRRNTPTQIEPSESEKKEFGGGADGKQPPSSTLVDGAAYSPEEKLFKISRVSVGPNECFRAEIEIPLPQAASSSPIDETTTNTNSGNGRITILGIGYAALAREACHAAAMHAEKTLDTLGIPVYALRNAQRKYAEQKRSAGEWAPLPGDVPKDLHGTALPKPLRHEQADAMQSYKEYVVVRHNEFYGNKYALMSPVCMDEFAKGRIETYVLKHSGQRLNSKIQMDQVVVPWEGRKHAMLLATITVPVPAGFGERYAKGLAVGKADAVLMACMHAELLLDTLGIRLFDKDEDQASHAKVAALYGRGAPFPNDPIAPFDTPSPPPLRSLFPNEDPLKSENLIDAYLEDFSEAAQLIQTKDIDHVDFSCYEKLQQFFEANDLGNVENYVIEKLGSTYKAMAVLPVPKEFGKRFAIGIGNTPLRARYVAAVHGVQVLDTLGVQLYPNNAKAQKDHARAVMNRGEWAPSPNEKPKSFDTPSPPALRVALGLQSLPVNLGLSARDLEEEKRIVEEQMSEKEKHIGEDSDDGGGVSSAHVEYIAVENIPSLQPDDGDGYILVPPEEELSTIATSLHTLVSPRKFDIQAQARIEDYLLRHGIKLEKAFKVKNVGDMSSYQYFRVELVLPVEVSHGLRTAIGEAPRVHEAKLLCCMHAELCLDALGLPIYDHSLLQRKHAQAARNHGRWAPAPGEPPQPRDCTVPPPIRKERKDSIRWAKFLK